MSDQYEEAIDELVEATNRLLALHMRADDPLWTYTRCPECGAGADKDADKPIEHSEWCAFGRLAAAVQRLEEAS